MGLGATATPRSYLPRCLPGSTGHGPWPTVQVANSSKARKRACASSSRKKCAGRGWSPQLDWRSRSSQRESSDSCGPRNAAASGCRSAISLRRRARFGLRYPCDDQRWRAGRTTDHGRTDMADSSSVPTIGPNFAPAGTAARRGCRTSRARFAEYRSIRDKARLERRRAGHPALLPRQGRQLDASWRRRRIDSLARTASATSTACSSNGLQKGGGAPLNPA